MDEEIQEWRNMWKQKKAKSLNLDEQIKLLNRLEKKESIRRKGLIAALIIILVCFFIKDPEFDKSNINNIIGLLLAVIGIIILLAMSYKFKFYLKKDETLSAHQNFIRKLKWISGFNLKALLIPVVILIIALNFLLLGFYDKGELFSYEFKKEYRLPIHFSTLVLFFLFYFLKITRLKKIQKGASATIHELETISDNEEEN